MSLNHTFLTAAVSLAVSGAAFAQSVPAPAPTVPAVNPAQATSPAVTTTPAQATNPAPAAPVVKPLAPAVAPTVVADGQFRGTLGLGASVASGNTRASNLALNGAAVRATQDDKISLYALALRSSAEGTTSGETMRLGGRYDRDINADLFGFGGLDLERNKLANLSLRSQLTAGVGYHALRTPTTTWDVFGGVAYSSDKYIDPMTVNGQVRSSYSYPSLMLAEESTHVLSATTSAKQRFVIYPNLKDSGEFRATFDAGVAVAMSSTLSLNVGLGAAYNSQPGDGRKKLDTLLTTGVSVKFD